MRYMYILYFKIHFIFVTLFQLNNKSLRLATFEIPLLNYFFLNKNILENYQGQILYKLLLSGLDFHEGMLDIPFFLL